MGEIMSDEEWRGFVRAGTRTGKLGVVRADGRPLVVPIWFLLEDDGVIRFQTSFDSAKVRALRHEPRVCLTIDDETPPFSFVLIEALAEVAPDDEAETWRVARACAARYMGEARAVEYARRNAVPGECVVELRVERVIAERDVSA
ncbi:MAG: PPOX class F420-dependent oxidoreductase [Acidimicrobiales bacterium]